MTDREKCFWTLGQEQGYPETVMESLRRIADLPDFQIALLQPTLMQCISEVNAILANLKCK